MFGYLDKTPQLRFICPGTSHHDLKPTLAQSLEEPLRDQSFYIALSHIELTILGQIDSPIAAISVSMEILTSRSTTQHTRILSGSLLRP